MLEDKCVIVCYTLYENTVVGTEGTSTNYPNDDLAFTICARRQLMVSGRYMKAFEVSGPLFGLLDLLRVTDHMNTLKSRNSVLFYSHHMLIATAS